MYAMYYFGYFQAFTPQPVCGLVTPLTTDSHYLSIKQQRAPSFIWKSCIPHLTAFLFLYPRACDRGFTSPSYIDESLYQTPSTLPTRHLSVCMLSLYGDCHVVGLIKLNNSYHINKAEFNLQMQQNSD